MIRLTRVALWALVAAGAVGGVVGALRATPVVAARPTATTAPPPALSGVAEVAARHWLLHHDDDRAAPADTDIDVDAVTAIALRPLAADYWAVTVLAVVRPAPSATPADWYLEVGVAATADGLRPVGAPAVVPAPLELRPLHPAAATLRALASDDPLSATAAAFLHALLTGKADPVRYAAPNAAIAPIAEPPFVDVTVERVAVLAADSHATRLRVAVTATTGDRSEFQLTYELTLSQRDGRWEITALRGAPTSSHADINRPSTATTGAPASPTSTTAPVPAAPGA